VTAVVVPSWLDSGDVVKIAYKKYNLSLGVGLNKVAGKVFRIGHLGNVNEVLVFLSQPSLVPLVTVAHSLYIPRKARVLHKSDMTTSEV